MHQLPKPPLDGVRWMSLSLGLSLFFCESLTDIHVQSNSVGIQGWIPVTTVPRIPGRDFSGEVVDVFDESAKEWVGKEVWGTGGARGFALSGTLAEVDSDVMTLYCSNSGNGPHECNDGILFTIYNVRYITCLKSIHSVNN